MGYTHYWRRSDDFAEETWGQLREIATALITYCEPTIAGWDGTGVPVVNDEEIRFNGLSGESHETFALTRDAADSFNFCKTAEKPYDVVVTALLIAAQNLQPMAILVTSDGEAEDWFAGLDLLKLACNKGAFTVLPNQGGEWSIPVTVADPEGELA